MEERGLHPTLRIKETKSHSLLGKKIILGVTGSIAAVKTFELARELIRHGAEVYGVMSSAATEIIHPYTLQYATGQEVMTKLKGNVEHIEFFEMKGLADLFLIAPCTANTLNKIACGIGDTIVTTFAATAFGSAIPLMIVPAMHEVMYDSPILVENINKLRKLGVTIVGPKIAEGKAKIAEIEDIILSVEHVLSPKKLFGKRILITSGPTLEPIDPIRVITSRSSGRTGVEIAKEAYRQGAEVTIIHKNELNFSGIKEIRVETAKGMIDACIDELHKGYGYDALISAAAISDFTVNASEVKIQSENDFYLHLIPVEKLIEVVRREFPNLVIVGFKAETNVSKEDLIKRAGEKMEKYTLDMIVANDVGGVGMGTEENEVYIIRNKGEKGEEEGLKVKVKLKPKHVKGVKKIIAEEIVKELIEII